MNLKSLIGLCLCFTTFGGAAIASQKGTPQLHGRYEKEILPFLDKYCFSCHDEETKKAELDLSRFSKVQEMLSDIPHWELVLERLESADMPPAKSKTKPTDEQRKAVIAWIKAVRQMEAERTAGDPGPVPARRLSNAEYDYTIRDLTGVDIRPTRTFPVDPANQAGFDNSAESLSMSPALVKKYLDAAREVAEHMVLQKEGFTFAPHPVVVDTDRDKWSVFRIVDFYKKQPTDYADYFMAAWRYKHRTGLGMKKASLADIAASSKVSPKYLKMIWSALAEQKHEVGPLADLQRMWNALPEGTDSTNEVAEACGDMREFVQHTREIIVPEVKNLGGASIQSGSQTLVMWKNRQMAANRRTYDTNLLWFTAPESSLPAETKVVTKPTISPAANPQRRNNRVQRPTPEIVQKGGVSIAPTVLTTNSSATAKMAGMKNRGKDSALQVPEDPVERAKYIDAFGEFAALFPDAFYITERARVYLDAEKEQENAGRLLSAGLHSMTGYFRDDQPLYDLILNEAEQAELDRLWDEFNVVSSVPQRMHISFVWFERTDSAYMRDPVFDPYRPEDKSVLTQEKIKSLGEHYLAKAVTREASTAVQQAIKEHFEIVGENIRRVEEMRAASIPSQLQALEKFAERAFRRPMTELERTNLQEFYLASRNENGVDHEEAMRDTITRILMSPSYLFRTDLVEIAGGRAKPSTLASQREGGANAAPLSDYALANRLSYFLWGSMPDHELASRAAAGDLQKPSVMKKQVHRMLADARVKNFATEFAGNWLDFRRFEQHNSVDRERYPAFNHELRQAMFEEPLHFFLDVVQSNRSVLDFLYARDTFVNAPLAKHYGFANASADEKTWVRVADAHDAGRGGLFGMSVFLTANSPGLRTSPVKRGYWVARRVLGERIPPPPPNVPELPHDEKSMGSLTLRETLAKHRQNESCAGCHARFDSFGLVFENYGPVGDRREKDFGGRPVDTRAEFPSGSEGEGLQGLLDYIKQHREDDFVENLCRKMLAYALGRTLILSDEPLIEEMKSRLAKNGYKFQTLIESIVTSKQFMNKRAGENLAKN